MLSALATAQQALPKYAHKNSPKTFTQHQLFACLALKNFLRTDYRGVVAHLEDNPSLTGLLALRRVPHFTTLQKASRRLLASANAQRLLDATTRLRSGRRRRVRTAAVDSTGLECTCASGYFIKKEKGTRLVVLARVPFYPTFLPRRRPCRPWAFPGNRHPRFASPRSRTSLACWRCPRSTIRRHPIARTCWAGCWWYGSGKPHS